MSKGKSTLFPNKYQSYRVFGGVAIAKNRFSARFSRFGKTQKRSFLRKSGRDRLRWSPISFFGAPGIPAKFRRSRTKIRGTSESKVGTAKNGQNPARRPKNGPPSGRTASYRKTEVIQSYLRMWGSYDPIESGPSDPKKWGLYGRSVKKCTFLCQKWAPAAAPRPAVRRSQHKKVVFLVSRHDGIKKFG